ncbi:MAG: hypothetical protein HKN79_09520 [Flavobacteriales bacterium]|nr:hypothetical protein [Flavobacteriales bacterium]
MEKERKKDRKVLWIIVAALVMLVALFWIFWTPGYNWHLHSYHELDDQPYGADLTYAYLSSLRDSEEFVQLDSTIGANLQPYIDSAVVDHNYMLFGYMPLLDSLSREHLFRFVEQGNAMHLYTGAVPAHLLEEWHQGECILYEEEPYFDWNGILQVEEDQGAFVDSLVHINLLHPDLRFEEDIAFGHYVKDRLVRYRWPYLDSTYFCAENTSLTALGTIGDHVNFFRVPHGEGYFYVHTTPKLLTNYYLIQDTGRRYADGVFAHLAPGPILWDQKRWKMQMDAASYADRYAQQEGPLTYLISQESLRWMLYLLFAMVVILFVFGTRRKQRPIPVIRPKENSSLEYVDTISELYFAQSGDGRIFKYLSEQFQFFIRNRYRIQFKWHDEQTWGILSKASGIPLSHIKSMTSTYTKGSYEPNVTSDLLTDYYRTLDYFYTNCK